MSLSQQNEFLNNINWRHHFGFECYGEKIGFRTDDESLRSKLQTVVPVVNKSCDYAEAENIFSLVVKENSELNGLYFNDELAMRFENFDESLLEYIGDKVLTVLARISLPEKFYLHAGAVSWDNAGILLPGISFAGKTTLTKEFLKAGAEFLSDDCIVLDNEGFLLPFPRDLAIREETGERIFRKANDFGTKNADQRTKLKIVLLTNFDEKSKWNPEIVSPGKSVLELLNNFFYRSSVGLKPQEIITTLSSIMSKVPTYKSARNEAAEVVEWTKKYLEKEFSETANV